MIRSILLICFITTQVFFGQDTELLTNTEKYWTAPIVEKPEYMETIVDSIFGTKIIRIVGNPGDTLPNPNSDPSLIGAVWPADQLRHGYSKRQPWNSDESMIYLDRISFGSAKKLWLDGETYEPLFIRKKPASRLRWSNTEPHIMYFINNEQVGRWDVVEDTTHPVVTFQGYSSCSFGEGEGNFTNDGKKVAVYAKRNSDSHRVIFIVDIENINKGNDIDVSDANKINNCTISPLGNYIVAIGDYGNGSDRVRVYDAVSGSIIWTEDAYGRPSHMDTQIDQNGDEVIVGIDKSNKGKIIKRRLADGEITLLAGGYASHASGRALKRLGWTIVTYQNRTSISSSYTYFNELVAVKLDGTRNERICHIHSNRFTYVAEAHGVPAPNGLRVMFASDWDTGDYPIQAYVVDFRDKVITNIKGEENIPEEYSIANYPNPFNPSTNIVFTLTKPEEVNVTVYDILGRQISEIVNKFYKAGTHKVKWFAQGSNGNQLSSGIYIVRIEAGTFSKSIKLMLLR